MKYYKKFLFALIFLFFCSFAMLKANNGQEQTCGTNEITPVNLSQKGGIYIPSQGTFKVLVVFVRFKDDNTYNPHWPAGSPPDVMNNFIDPYTNTNSTNLFNLTNYFDAMSMGTYNVIGNAIYVETPKNMSDYGYPTPSRISATKDVIQNAVDPLVNFADYDNWTFNSDYTHTNQPDGTVDMIIMVWRGQVFAGWGGEASLGGGSYYTVENGTKTIKTNFGGGNGSGLTAQDWEERNTKYNFHRVLHEFAHWLLGGSHPYSNNDDSDEHAFWGMMRHSNDGICANAYERERLAWINPVEITSDIINAPINDYVTTGVAYKYHPVNGAPNEYYYFENHQKLSIYDDAANNPNDNGIFVLHQKDVYKGQNNIRCVTAGGNFNWVSTGITSCFGGVPVRSWKTTSLNRAGYNRRDKLPYTENGVTTWDWIWSIDGEGCAGYPYGDNSNNAFNLTYKNVFSPASNPYSDTWNNIPENFTMEVYNQSGTTLNAHFYLSNPYAGNPSKVENFVANFSGTYPSFTWEPNLEPDLQGYRVYKKLYTVDSGTMTSYVFKQSTETTYTDNSFTIGSGRFAVDNAEYWAVAIDNDNKLSVDTKHYNTNGTSGIQWKIGIDGKDNILSYKLNQNYPNPFNPSTKIEFQIPHDAHVSLAIYNSLGQKVKELVNNNLSVGKYSVDFNAESASGSLPSGLYIYRLTTSGNLQNYTEVKKMLLLK